MVLFLSLPFYDVRVTQPFLKIATVHWNQTVLWYFYVVHFYDVFSLFFFSTHRLPTPPRVTNSRLTFFHLVFRGLYTHRVEHRFTSRPIHSVSEKLLRGALWGISEAFRATSLRCFDNKEFPYRASAVKGRLNFLQQFGCIERYYRLFEKLMVIYYCNNRKLP